MPIYLSNSGSRQGALGFEKLGESYVPTTGEVLSAGFRAGFAGEGSTVQDVAAVTVAGELGRQQDLGFFQKASGLLDSALLGTLRPDEVRTVESQPLTEDEWKTSKYFREGLSYQEGMTTRSAAIVANLEDRKREREFIYSKTGTGGAGLFIASSFAGAMADAKNVALIVGTMGLAGPVVGAVGAVRAASAGTSVVRGYAAGTSALRATVGARIALAATEGVVTTAPTVVTGLQNASLIQQQYTAQDAALDFFASVGLGVALQGVGEAVGAAWRRHFNIEDAREVGKLVTSQIAAGEKVDAKPIIEAKVAEYLPTIPTAALDAEPKLIEIPRKGGRSYWKAEYEAGGQKISITRADPQEAVAIAKEQLRARTIRVAQEMGLSPQDINTVENFVRVKSQVESFDVEARAREIAPTLQKPSEIQARLDGAKSGKRKLQASLDKAVEDAMPQARQAAQQELRVLRQQYDVAQRTALDVQIQTAQSRLPDFAKRQLEPDLKSQAARSMDPRAVEIEADVLPAERVDPDAETPLSLSSDDELDALVESLGDEFREAVDDLKEREKMPEAIREYVKCKVGA